MSQPGKLSLQKVGNEFCGWMDAYYTNVHGKQLWVCRPTVEQIKEEVYKRTQAGLELNRLYELQKDHYDKSIADRISALLDYLDPFAKENKQLLVENFKRNYNFNHWMALAPMISVAGLEILGAARSIANALDKSIDDSVNGPTNNKQFYVFNSYAYQSITASPLYKSAGYLLFAMQMLFLALSLYEKFASEESISSESAEKTILQSTAFYMANAFYMLGTVLSATSRLNYFYDTRSKENIHRILPLSNKSNRKYISLALIDDETRLKEKKIFIPQHVKSVFKEQAKLIMKNHPDCKPYLCKVEVEMGTRKSNQPIQKQAKWMVVYADYSFEKKKWQKVFLSTDLELTPSYAEITPIPMPSASAGSFDNTANTPSLTQRVTSSKEEKSSKPAHRAYKENHISKKQEASPAAKTEIIIYQQPAKWAERLKSSKDARDKAVWSTVLNAAKNLSRGTVDSTISLRKLSGTANPVWEVRFVSLDYRIYLLPHQDKTYILRAGNKATQTNDIHMADMAASYIIKKNNS